MRVVCTTKMNGGGFEPMPLAETINRRWPFDHLSGSKWVSKSTVSTAPATPNKTIFSALATSARHRISVEIVLQRRQESFRSLFCIVWCIPYYTSLNVYFVWTFTTLWKSIWFGKLQSEHEELKHEAEWLIVLVYVTRGQSCRWLSVRGKTCNSRDSQLFSKSLETHGTQTACER